MTYKDLIKHPNPVALAKWTHAGINKFAHLTQGHGDISSLNVVTFISKLKMPESKQATYPFYVVEQLGAAGYKKAAIVEGYLYHKTRDISL